MLPTIYHLISIKTISFVFAIAVLVNPLFGQTGAVGVGTVTPDNSAMLDVSSTGKGVLIPRMTTAQRAAIPSPATGLMVYDGDTNSFWYFDGTQWVEVMSGTDNDQQDLSLTGHTLAITNDASTVDLSGYLDNTDNQTLNFSSPSLSISNGNSVDLSALQDGTGTDNQTLSFSSPNLTISNGNRQGSIATLRAMTGF